MERLQQRLAAGQADAIPLGHEDAPVDPLLQLKQPLRRLLHGHRVLERLLPLHLEADVLPRPFQQPPQVLQQTVHCKDQDVEMGGG
jgi:hypothetical protein